MSSQNRPQSDSEPSNISAFPSVNRPVPMHRTPYISVAKLGEYVAEANPSRRRTIVHDMKYGNPPKMTRYREAYEPIVSAVTSQSTNPVLEAIETLSGVEYESEWREQDRVCTIEALEKFCNVFEELDGSGASISRHSVSGRFTCFGVEVSVRPEIVIPIRRSGVERVGAIKFVFAKTKEMTEETALCVGTAVSRYLEEGFGHATPMPSKIQVVDLFAQNVFRAPRATSRRMANIENACQEIQLWWAQL